MDNLSLLITTKDRSNFLSRQLNYLRITGFSGQILIGDSSGGDHLDRNRRLIREISINLFISYVEAPGESIYKCLIRLLGECSTKYVSFIGDDDFLVPSGLRLCATFLDQNEGYAAAHGVGIKFRTQDDEPFGGIIHTKKTQQPILEDGSPSIRFLHQRTFSGWQRITDSHFSVHRIENYLEAYLVEFSDIHPMFREPYLNCLLPILGKVKELNCLTLMRQLRSNNFTTKYNSSHFQWVLDERWRIEYEMVATLLAAKLSEVEGIAKDKAKETIELGFKHYFGARMMKESRQLLPASLREPNEPRYGVAYSRIRRLFVGYPGQILRELESKAGKEKYGFTLESLLSRNHRYHEDFIAVYNACQR